MVRTENNNRNLVKVISVIIGVVTLVALIGYLIVQIIRADEMPPKLHIISSYDSTGDQYEIEVENSGDITAKEVGIQLHVKSQDSVMGTISLSIPYVPAKSSKNTMVSLDNQWLSADTLEVVSFNFQIP